MKLGILLSVFIALILMVGAVHAVTWCITDKGASCNLEVKIGKMNKTDVLLEVYNKGPNDLYDWVPIAVKRLNPSPTSWGSRYANGVCYVNELCNSVRVFQENYYFAGNAIPGEYAYYAKANTMINAVDPEGAPDNYKTFIWDPLTSIYHSPAALTEGDPFTITVETSTFTSKVRIYVNNVAIEPPRQCTADKCTYKADTAAIGGTHEYFAIVYYGETGQATKTKTYTASFIPPVLTADNNPPETLSGEVMTFTANVDAPASVTPTKLFIYIDGALKKTCAGATTCSYSDSALSVRTHNYYVKFTYKQGAASKATSTPTKSFAVQAPCYNTGCPAYDECSGKKLKSYATGQCLATGCKYTITSTRCTFGCNNVTLSCGPDPCDTYTCDTPPADYCRGKNLFTYDVPGVCNGKKFGTAKQCKYTKTKTVCQFGCNSTSLSCMPNICLTGAVCDTPPGPKCLASGNLRPYNAEGNCDVTKGKCVYTLAPTTELIKCAKGCKTTVNGGVCL